MKTSQKVITFLAQKVVHHRNQAGHFRLEAKKGEVIEENLVVAEQHDAIANTAELWITELRMNGL